MSCADACASSSPAAWRRWMREQSRLEHEIAELTEQMCRCAAEIGAMEASQHSLTERGYELDREATGSAESRQHSAVELERAAARERSNAERVSELESRMAAAAGELEQTRTQMGGIAEEREQQRTFLETAAGEATCFPRRRRRHGSRKRAPPPRSVQRRAAAGEHTPPRHAPAHAWPAMRATARPRRREPGGAGA